MPDKGPDKGLVSECERALRAHGLVPSGPMARQLSGAFERLLRVGSAGQPGRSEKHDAADAAHTWAGRAADALSRAPDPQTALASYARLCDFSALPGHEEGEKAVLSPSSEGFARLVAVLGASRQMGLLMSGRPGLVRAVCADGYSSHVWGGERRKQAFDVAVAPPLAGGDGTGAVRALRQEYYRELAAIMAWDVTSPDPLEVQPAVSRSLSDLAGCAIGEALRIAQAVTPDSGLVRLAVIAMGKLGGQELNYVSDCDLIYVCDPVSGPHAPDPQRTRAIGTAVCREMQRVCEAAMPQVGEPPLWKIDTTLRPEGQDGDLVRTLESHRAYYKRWAENWEFQALLKARFLAGDEELGHAYERMAQSLVWSASTRPGFVFDCQRMRTRVENTIPPELREREVKLGKGGLRDVEFTVQMLQLVHGRTDATLRSRSTLEALAALVAGGYVGKEQGRRLARDYRFERVLEHRQQMWELRRTHLFPDLGQRGNGGLDRPRQVSVAQIGANADVRRLARVFGLRPDELVSRYDRTRREVRRLHLDIYYRPMLPALAQLSPDDLSLTVPAARARYASIGFADPDSAMCRVGELTRGLTRAAKINRIILPTMLHALGQGQDPDMGLLALARLERGFIEGSPYLGMLRDSPSAADRLCAVVSNSRFLADELIRSVDAVSWLGDDAALHARSRGSLDVQCRTLESRFPDDPGGFATGLRSLRRQEITRMGLGWFSRILSADEEREGVSDLSDALIASALRWACRRRAQMLDGTDGRVEIGVIGMGRLGGREANFCSDADLMVIYDVVGRTGTEDGELRPAVSLSSPKAYASAVLQDMRLVLSGPASLEKGLELDFDLRPEGADGPLVRSLDSCREYYRDWAQTWEHQALLRARTIAQDGDVADRFVSQVADPLRYPEQGLTHAEITEIRRLKARMEAERLPRGIRPDHYLKLGRGGLSDVEWTVQLLQMRNAAGYPDLRTVSTLPALAALEKDGLIAPCDAHILREAWSLESDARNAIYLWQGKADRADILPEDEQSLGGIRACMGLGAHRGGWLENRLLSAMRRCRQVVERLFYGRTDPSAPAGTPDAGPRRV